MKASGILAALGLLASAVSAQSWKTIDPVVIKGQHFFYKTNGTEFQIVGVAYQEGVSSNTSGVSTTSDGNYIDPLADSTKCARDIPQLVALRTNTIRVYAVDPKADHDECMRMLADAGIYVVADLSQPDLSINRDTPSWNVELYQRYTSVIDSLSKYQNTLGFFAGNEVSNTVNTTAASAFVKAAVRDSKNYIKSKNYRAMGVGYATYDGPIRTQLAEYFNCDSGDNGDSSIDFWGYNVYSWCGDSSYQASSYEDYVNFFSTYSVPVFFAEYGCNKVEPRTFSDVPVVYSKPMSDVWSGGIVYMYFQEENNYGLVNINNGQVSRRPDFTYLSSQLAKIKPTLTNAADYNPQLTRTSCPSVGPSWSAKASPLPPAPNPQLCTCGYDAYGCVVNSDNATAYGDVFNYICAQGNYCDGIAHNATTGNYGAYAGCNPKEQLDFVMNRYYQGRNRAASACAFSGLGSTKATSSATAGCSSLLAAAGANGRGSVPSPVGGQVSAGNSGSGSGAMVGVHAPSSTLTLLSFGAYLAVAVVSGAGMLLL